MPSLYEIIIPKFITNLKILAFLLNKGEKHVGEDKVSTLLESRLIEDMYPLIYQIRTSSGPFSSASKLTTRKERVSDTAKGLAVRVGGVENESWEDNETTFPELHARIAKTIAFLEKVDKESFDSKEDAEVILPGKNPRVFTGTSYVTDFANHNFYFHFVTAYALLRKEGVPVGKLDYMGLNLPK